MLVLTRKLSESIIIDHDIKIIVLGIKEGAVRIGIEAKPEIEVHRLEVHERIYGAPK